MALFGFEKDTLLDLTVNFIPLGIILFFIAAFAVVPAFGVDPVFSGMQFALMISMFLLLGVLTYYAGRAIENAEKAAEAAALEEPAESDPKVEGTTAETAALDDDGADAEPSLERTDDDA
ncbi:DUF6684 family protein [Halomicroarcula sp. GCM10025817]|uniref:DUF6684 family protein n=1 Tax=Haloarcula TaxID=2237 RepID=UPI0023E810C3|nr:DUF6684 family protein [Halomicroarcula sp. SYNS111]